MQSLHRWPDTNTSIMLSKRGFPPRTYIKQEQSRTLYFIDVHEGEAQSTTFVVAPEGLIRFAMVADLFVVRAAGKLLRVLDVPQTNI